MTTIRQIREEIQKQAEGGALEFKAVMGRADGTVKSHGSDIYVTLYNGNVIEVYNGRLPRKPFRKIIIGFDESEAPGLLQVLRYDYVYNIPPALTVMNHKEQHAWFSFDPVEIYAEQIIPLLPRASTGMIVHVYGGEYMANGAYHVMLSQDIDMSAEIPATGAEWVNAEIDENGAITFNHGANKAARELLLPEDRAATSGVKKLLFSARMYAGLVNFIQTRLDSDIFDPRFTGLASGGSATSLDWSDLLNVPTEFNPDLNVTDAIYPRKWLKSVAPTVNDDIDLGYEKSDIWIDQSNGDAYININNANGAADWVKVSSGSSEAIFQVEGRLAVINSAAQPILITKETTISAVYVYLENPGTAGSTVIDIYQNDLCLTSIFSNVCDNRPEIFYDDVNGWVKVIPSVTDFVEGDVLFLSIDQAATLAENMVVILEKQSSGGAGGTGLTVTDNVTTVENVGKIVVASGTVVDDTGGQVTIYSAPDYILVRDEKADGTAGGTFTQGAWQTRVINTEVSDAGGHCSIASNQITFGAGTYECRISVPGHSVDHHKAVLYNVSDSANELIGSNAYCASGDNDLTHSLIVGKFVIAASKTFEVRHRCSATRADYGFGAANTFGVIEIYTQAEFWKVG